jgi:hypothetical protein
MCLNDYQNNLLDLVQKDLVKREDEILAKSFDIEEYLTSKGVEILKFGTHVYPEHNLYSISLTDTIYIQSKCLYNLNPIDSNWRYVDKVNGPFHHIYNQDGQCTNVVMGTLHPNLEEAINVFVNR